MRALRSKSRLSAVVDRASGKEAYRAAMRAKAIGPEGIDAARAIVASGSYAKINEVAVDLYSASALVAVYDALNDANKLLLASRPVALAVRLAFKCCGEPMAMRA